MHMDPADRSKLHVVTGRANPVLAGEIAEHLGIHLGETHLGNFANGEIHCRFGESVRGMDVFIIQSHGAIGTNSINDALMEHLIMVDAARRASAARITAVMPFYGYGRQDRKAEGREPITAKLVANMFQSAGANRLMSVDLHSGQIQGFFDQPFDHLVAMPVLVSYLESIESTLGETLVVVSPDAGRVKVAERYANALHADLAIVHKRRVRGEKNTVEAKEVVGNVEGRTCVLIDDMIDTAGTIVAAADQLVERGARTVHAAATHGVLSGPAIDRLKNSVIAKIVVTDTLPLPSEKQIDKIEVLSVATIIGDAIDAVYRNTSVSEIFGGKNQN
jgi:ribose-phosphate pyrophosphokinase